jgi:hypothetical protein
VPHILIQWAGHFPEAITSTALKNASDVAREKVALTREGSSSPGLVGSDWNATRGCSRITPFGKTTRSGLTMGTTVQSWSGPRFRAATLIALGVWRLRERLSGDASKLAAADQAFGWDPRPWCQEIF